MNYSEEEKKAIEIVKNWIKYERCEDTEPVIHETILNLIEKQQQELQLKDKVIEEMANTIDKISENQIQNGLRNDFEFCDESCMSKEEYIPCNDCIKQYFINKVKGE